jgi:hypothetical protein
MHAEGSPDANPRNCKRYIFAKTNLAEFRAMPLWNHNSTAMGGEKSRMNGFGETGGAGSPEIRPRIPRKTKESKGPRPMNK